jgi:hypothetical protein
MTEHPEHLTPEASDRGFARLPAIHGAYGGDAMVWESSSAEYPRLWLKVEVPTDLREPTGPTTEAVIHLDAAEAWKLAEQIMTMVQNHYHGDARPGGRVYDEVAAVGPETVCNWKRPEHIRVTTGVPTYREITLVCEHGHGEGYPVRRIEAPTVLDPRVAEFIEAHKHEA